MKHGTSGAALLVILALAAGNALATGGSASQETGEPELLAVSLVLFFPPLTVGNDPTQPPGKPQPPGPPGVPEDPRPEDPPHHNPEPATLVTGVVGGSLACLFGWRRRRGRRSAKDESRLDSP